MPEEISKRITPKTKILVLVSPNNPTGAVTPPEKIIEIAEIIKKNNLIVIADEIYADLVYEKHKHLSIGSLPDMKDRALTLNGFSKTIRPKKISGVRFMQYVIRRSVNIIDFIGYFVNFHITINFIEEGKFLIML